MENDNDSTSKSSETADDPVETRSKTENNLLAGNNSQSSINQGIVAFEAQEPSTSSTNATSAAVAVPERSGTKRNYRRRTGNSEDDSSNDEAAEPEIMSTAPAENPTQNQPQSSDSDDVSLDELRVSATDDDNNANARR